MNGFVKNACEIIFLSDLKNRQHWTVCNHRWLLATSSAIMICGFVNKNFYIYEKKKMKNVVLKTSLLLIIWSSVVFQTHAQEQDELSYYKKAEKYRRIKTAGAVLAITGTTMMVISVAISTVSYDDSSNGINEKDRMSETVEAITFLGGAACLATGIPLWIVGGVNEARYERKAKKSSVNLGLNPERPGLILSYRF